MYKWISFSKLSNSSTWIVFYIIWGNYKLLICPLGSIKRGHGPRTATTAHKPRLITSYWMLLLAQASFVIHQASVICLLLSGRCVVPASFHHLRMYASWHLDRVLCGTLTFSEATLAAITGYKHFSPLNTYICVWSECSPPCRSSHELWGWMGISAFNPLRVSILDGQLKVSLMDQRMNEFFFLPLHF